MVDSDSASWKITEQVRESRVSQMRKYACTVRRDEIPDARLARLQQMRESRVSQMRKYACTVPVEMRPQMLG